MNKKIIFTTLSLFALPFLTIASHPTNTEQGHQKEKIGSENSSVDIKKDLIEVGEASVRNSDNVVSSTISPMQSREIMDGIGRNKKELERLKGMLNTSSGVGNIVLRKEIIDAIKSGKSGEDLLKIIREESSRLKDRSLNFKAEIDSNREKLKKALNSKVTDVKKIETGLVLGDNLNSLNGKITDRYSEILNKLENSLKRLSSKTDLLEKNGKDVSAIKKTLADNMESIEMIRLAIKTQAQKIYIANVESVKTLRQDFWLVRKNLSNDLKNLEEAIKIVKSEVVNLTQMLITQ